MSHFRNCRKEDPVTLFYLFCAHMAGPFLDTAFRVGGDFKNLAKPVAPQEKMMSLMCDSESGAGIGGGSDIGVEQAWAEVAFHIFGPISFYLIL